MNVRGATKIVLTGSLLYATWLVVKCPCESLVGCSQQHFYAAILIPAVIVGVMNARMPT
jgi:hypothetical protein